MKGSDADPPQGDGTPSETEAEPCPLVPVPGEEPADRETEPEAPHLVPAPMRRFEPRRAGDERLPQEGGWGCGLLTFVKVGPGRAYGGWQGSCRWHAKNSQTGCKKVILEIAERGPMLVLRGGQGAA